VAYFPDLNHIVRYKTVSSFDQLQCGFTFPYTAFSHDQHSNTVYVHEHPVDGNAWRKLHIEPADDLCGKVRCFFLCLKDRNIQLIRLLQEYFIRFQIPAENNARYSIREKLCIHFLFSFFRKSLQICVLYVSDNLNTLRIKMVEEP